MRERTVFWALFVPAFFWGMDKLGWALCPVIRYHARTDTPEGRTRFTRWLAAAGAAFWLHIVFGPHPARTNPKETS